MKKYPLMIRRSPTQKDLDNLAQYRALTGSGRSPGSQLADPPDLLRSKSNHSGVKKITPELDKQLTPEEIKIKRNDQERECRLRAMQDRLEAENELRESGYLIHKINI